MATSLALTFVLLAARANVTPVVRLHVAQDSTCDAMDSLATRLVARGIVVSETDASGVDVDVRAMALSERAEAEIVIHEGSDASSRLLRASTCAEVLDALAFTLGLALERSVESEPPPEVVPPPTREAERAAVPVAEAGLRWGVGGEAGVFAGAAPVASPAIGAHVGVESTARGLFAPSASLGAMFVLPSTTESASRADVTFTLLTSTLDGCPLRVGGGRLGLRPCLELELGRLQGRSSGFVGARLDSSPWVALAVAARGQAELGAGIALDLALSAGSPLVQNTFFIGSERVFGVGSFLFSSTAGLTVHFP